MELEPADELNDPMENEEEEEDEEEYIPNNHFVYGPVWNW